ncbi:hypothetical protein QJQ45_009799 [Haematococcus lacustris]|nr:hypothetical protein QJQ45_009799 [Haematococcus lacustris]
MQRQNHDCADVLIVLACESSKYLVVLRGCKKTKMTSISSWRTSSSKHSHTAWWATYPGVYLCTHTYPRFPLPSLPAWSGTVDLSQIQILILSQCQSPSQSWSQLRSPPKATWDQESGQLVANQLRRWKLIKSQVKQASGLNNARRTTQRWLAPIQPHLQHLAAASSAGTSLEANLKHSTVTLATWDAVWEVNLYPKCARQQLRLCGVQDRALEQFFKNEVASCKPPQVPCSSQAATQPAASEPGPSTPPPAKRSKRTKAEQASEPTKGKGKAQGSAAKAKPASQPGRWLDRDCNAALNMQRNGQSRWCPLELCWWPEQEKLPAKGKEYPGLGYKRLRDRLIGGHSALPGMLVDSMRLAVFIVSPNNENLGTRLQGSSKSQADG